MGEDDGTICTPGDLQSLGGGSYDYDKVGNRTDLGAVIEAGNRLTGFDGYTLAYDADGNLRSKYKSGLLDQTLYWNSLGQLDSVRTDGQLTTFGYDGFGRRVRKTGPYGETRYIHDGDDLLLELDGAGNIVTEYTYYPGTDRPHSMRRSGASLYYFATDFPGNVLGVVDGNRSLVNHYRYDPFGGTESASEQVSNSLRFAARQFDAETG